MAEMSWKPAIGDPDHMMYMLLSSDRCRPRSTRASTRTRASTSCCARARTTIDDKAARPALPRGAAARRSRTRRGSSWTTASRSIVHRKRVQGFKLHPNFDLRADAGVAAVGGRRPPGATSLRRLLLLRCRCCSGSRCSSSPCCTWPPGDPAAIMLGAQATREDVERLRRDLGLDRPLAGAVRAAGWAACSRATSAARSRSGAQVLPEVLLRFKATLVLTGARAPALDRRRPRARHRSPPRGRTRCSTGSARSASLFGASMPVVLARASC